MTSRALIALGLLAFGCTTETRRSAPSDTLLTSAVAVRFSEEWEVRFAVYAERVHPRGSNVIFLAESDDFIRELQRRSGNHRLRSERQSIFDERKECIVDQATGESGMRIGIDRVKVEGASAVVHYSMYATPRGASSDTVRLKKVGTRWTIAEWTVDLVS